MWALMAFKFSAQAATQADSHHQIGLLQTNPNSLHILHLNIKALLEGTRFDDARGRCSPIRGDSLLLFDPLSGRQSSADEWRMTRASTVYLGVFKFSINPRRLDNKGCCS